MAKAAIILYTPKTLKDGTHPVVLRVHHNGERKYISLKYSCMKTQWSTKANRFNSKYENYIKLNQVLTAKQKEADDYLITQEQAGQPFSFDDFIREFKKKPERSGTTFKAYCKKVIDELDKEEKVGNARAYKYVQSVWERFKPGMKLNSITPGNITDLVRSLKKDGNKDTSISMCIRTTRALIKRAIKSGDFAKENYPFTVKGDGSEGFRFQVSSISRDTNPRSLSKADVEKIKNADFKNTELEVSHLYGLFSFYTRGMNFVDMASLTWKDSIVGDRIVYVRTKTQGKKKKETSILIRPEIKRILSYFKKVNGFSNYIFPILDDAKYTSEKSKRYRINNCLGRFNDDLRTIAGKLKITANLTSYVYRHSYADILKKSGVSIEKISQALGHDDTKTTNTYLRQFDHSEIDEAEAANL